MVDRDMISEISELLDEKLEGLKTDVKGLKTDVKGLKTDVKGLKTKVDGLETDVSGLKAEMKHVRVVLLENNVIPRLSTIEECYLDTFQRYKERTEQFDKMSSNIEVLNSVVAEHSRKLEKIPG